MKPFPPTLFSSQDEYETYIGCLNKARPGSEVRVYTNYKGHTIHRITAYTRQACVVGVRMIDDRSLDKHQLLLLATNNLEELPTFYSADSGRSKFDHWSIYADNFRCHYTINEYKYFYKAYLGDVRIASIIRTKPT